MISLGRHDSGNKVRAFSVEWQSCEILLPRVCPGSHDKANLNWHLPTRLVCRRSERLCRLPNIDATHLHLSARLSPALPTAAEQKQNNA